MHGLLALMELQASRLAARDRRDGAPVPLPEQDRARWDRLLIRRGLAALDARRGAWAAPTAPTRCRRARRLPRPGRARRGHRLEADRRALRARCAAVTPSPVVELNRAVAHGWPSARKPGWRCSLP